MPFLYLLHTKGKYFIIVIAVISLATFSSIGMVAYTQLYNQRYEFVSERYSRLSSQVATAMSLWLTEQVDLAHTLAEAPLMAAFCKNPHDPELRWQVERFLQDVHSLKKHFTLLSILLFLPDKVPSMVIEVNGKPVTIKNGTSVIDSIGGKSLGVGGIDFSYIRAIHDGANSFVSEAKANAIKGLPELFMVTVPVVDPEGNRLGVLGFGVTLEYFNNQFVTDFMLGDSGRLKLIDARGFVIGSNDTSDILDKQTQLKGQQLLPYLSLGAPNVFRQRIDGKQMDFAAAPVKTSFTMAQQWWVVFHRESQELHAELAGSLKWIVLCCSLGALFVVGIVWSLRTAAARMLEAEVKSRKEVYVDCAPYGVVLITRDGYIRDVNPAACAIFGVSADEMQTLRIHDFFDAESALLSAGTESSPMEYDAKQWGGKEMIVSCSVRTLDKDHSVFFIRDATDLVRHRSATQKLSKHLVSLLEESEDLRDKASKASQAKSEFLANMSHEIRTPMNAIIGLGYLASKTDLTQKQSDYITKILSSAQSLLGIINDILDFSKIEADKLQIESVPFDLNGLIVETHTLFDQMVHDKGIELHFNIAADVPRQLIGDPLRLRQILNNLLSNAIKFTAQGNVRTFCTLRKQEDGNATLSFKVEDTGIGIPEEQQEAIFTAFGQADASTTRQFGGTGLGLVICRRLALLMGGDIFLNSTVGKGTTVELVLPFGRDVSSGLEGTGMNRVEDETAWVCLEGKKALLAEDNLINQQIAQELLEAVGMQVDIVENGQNAVEYMKTHRVRILFSWTCKCPLWTGMRQQKKFWPS